MSKRFFEDTGHASKYADFRPKPPPQLGDRILSFLKTKVRGPFSITTTPQLRMITIEYSLTGPELNESGNNFGLNYSVYIISNRWRMSNLAKEFNHNRKRWKFVFTSHWRLVSHWNPGISALCQYIGPLELCVDVGCGNGQCVPLFSSRFRKVLATDISPAQIELALSSPYPSNVQFQWVDSFLRFVGRKIPIYTKEKNRNYLHRSKYKLGWIR